MSAIAAKRAMIHDDIKADPLLTRLSILCMLLDKAESLSYGRWTRHVLWRHVCTCLAKTVSMSAPPPPTPQHILRSHSSPISALFTSGDNERIYSGDASGKVVVTSTRSLRAITQWNPHSDSILGVEEWDSYIVTYACDFHCLTSWSS